MSLFHFEEHFNQFAALYNLAEQGELATEVNVLDTS